MVTGATHLDLLLKCLLVERHACALQQLAHECAAGRVGQQRLKHATQLLCVEAAEAHIHAHTSRLQAELGARTRLRADRLIR